MPVQGNFAVIPFGEHIGDNASDLDLPWVTFVGNQSTLKPFEIAGQPVGHSYILIQTYQVGVNSHAIFVNGVQLPGLNIPTHEGWHSWMVVLKDELLRTGQNTVQIVRDVRTTDDFVVWNIAVHWHEYIP
ncbi:MAG: hypothetical protein K8L99_01365 [Anaerolineae bacterium]|nr:hypothetical protein [Anaerolineae bacterium]